MGRKIQKCLAGIIVIGVALIFGINGYVVNSQKKNIILANEAKNKDQIDCILVLGCLVHKNGTMSYMLRDRMNRAVELYKNGVAPKILVSGDHGNADYDEVNAMKQYAVKRGVASEDVFMDHAGFSTYESMYRAKAVFQVERCVVVTQRYHLYRALYDGEKQGIKVYGVCAKEVDYAGQRYRDLRETVARDKDVFVSWLHHKPTYLGDQIPIQGNGDETNDDN
ncbi:MAG: ElyC/SanA/YdcF family protein [Anaerostipes sp.]|nr:ElyC/SanA/YdcF family protein [Anaerostipes sp.]MDD4371773.1 ElyC/SanA/YdcF family protein [Anaerostipes sp.]